MLMVALVFGRSSLSSFVLCVSDTNNVAIEVLVGANCAEKVDQHGDHASAFLSHYQGCHDWQLTSQAVKADSITIEIYYGVVAYLMPRSESDALRASALRNFEQSTPIEQGLERQISSTILVI